MAIEHIGKSPELTNKGIIVTPIGRCHLRRAHALFQEQYPHVTISDFIQLYGNITPHKYRHAFESNIVVRDVIVARDYNDHILALYTYIAQAKKDYIVEHLVIPGPLYRQTALKKFIEHMIGYALEFHCKRIIIEQMNDSDWKEMFFIEVGGRRIKPDQLQINLSAKS
tara:strand:+ start:105 stop:608 length:504 start_codon:yes stop_codon:yes gene_type:complete